jgi:hypothetical protein
MTQIHDARELLDANGIKLDNYGPGEHPGPCPRCSHLRQPQHRRLKCLSVKIDNRGATWHCNHCGWCGPSKETFAAIYHYRGYQKVRYPAGHEPPYRTRHSNSKGWQWGAGGADTGVLYRCDEAQEAIALGYRIAVAEGEKDVNNLWALGIPATCSPHGASEPDRKSKWTAAHSEQLRGADIVVFNDNDPAGYAHAEETCRLSIGIAKRVCRLDLALHWPDMPAGADVSDWLAKGHTREELDALIAGAPEFVQQTKTQETEPEPRARQKTADILIELSAKAEELFHTPDGTAFASIPVDSHLENWPVRSKGFRRWLTREFFLRTSSAPNSDAIQSATNVIEARAHYDGKQQPVHIRVGACEQRLYLDLADARWRAVEIDENGWRVIDRAAIAFRRAAGMQALPEPVSGGSINDLRGFLNVEKNKDDDPDFVLAVSFVLATLRDRGPYPVLCLAGEHGSAKSTFTAVLRRLIDPNSAPLRALSREDRDLFIAANNAHLLAFDNISNLPDWISDTLCRLATGGGFATRQLYSDQDEALFDAMRPIILNGIEDIVGRPDLADRSLFLDLKSIAEDKRKPELTFWNDFERAHPRILGALLDGVVHGLQKLPSTRLKKTPRMADFALWATACETAFWQSGTFSQAYDRNRQDAVGTVIEADLIASAVQSFIAKQPGTEWHGTSAKLLGALKMAAGEDQTKLREWPATPRALSGRLRRAAATLRKVGVEITFERKSGGNRVRTITIASLGRGNDRPDSPDRPASHDFNGLGRDDCGDDTIPSSPIVPPIVPPNPLKDKAWDGADGRDANFHTQTGNGENGVCAQCNGAPDGKERLCLVDGEEVWLHRECEPFFRE